MSISTQITRLTGAKQTLTDKMDAAGYAGLSGKKIDQLIDMLDLSSGGGGSIVVTEEQDSHGGTIVHITGEEVVLQTKTVTPSESRQTITPDSGKTGLSSVVVEAIDNTYVGSGVTRKGAATITPSKSQQTISSGQYLTGTQTIAAIPAAYQDVTGVTAAAGDVVSGKKIVSSTGAVVNGTLVIQHYYTGSSAPSASLGSDGDIYLQTGG